MSPNPYPFFSISQSDKPEQVKLKIRMLIRLYVKDPSPFIASAVVEHIAALLAYPKYIDDIEQRCQLRNLEMHWRCLSWLDSTSHLIEGELLMDQLQPLDVQENEIVDFPTIITVICHLMTLYALHPCEPLASNINRHINVVLNSNAGDYLGEWKGTFKQIQSQWELISKRHLTSAKSKQSIVAH